MPMRPSKLKLVLDATTAGGEHAVILDVLQMCTRTRNTCNVKIGTFPVHLGLDHAMTHSISSDLSFHICLAARGKI
jgi:hypothetical protein